MGKPRTTKIDTSKMVPISKISESKLDDAESLFAFAKEAKEFLAGQTWCDRVRDGWLDRGWGGVLAVFYFMLAPRTDSGADDAVWVVTGDLPPAYLDVPSCPNGATALDAYVGVMQEWVEAVKAGQPVDDLVPVNLEPSEEYADMLDSRLKFIDSKILSMFRDELES